MTYGWPTNFPAVCSSGEYAEIRLMEHPLFAAAKKMGDRDAARKLVAHFINRDAVRLFGRRQSRARLLVAGRISDANQIPIAFAEAVSGITGCPLDMGVSKVNQAKHTGKGSMWRLLDRPRLEGRVRTGASYILLDDVITQGGTISELRQHVMRQGCRVVGVAALAHATSRNFGDGVHIAQRPETRMALVGKFKEGELREVLADAGVYGGNLSALTESEALTLMYYKNIDSLKKAIAAEQVKMLGFRDGAAEGLAAKSCGRPSAARR